MVGKEGRSVADSVDARHGFFNYFFSFKIFPINNDQMWLLHAGVVLTQ